MYMRTTHVSLSLGFLLSALSILGTSCSNAYVRSIGGESAQTFERTYVTDVNTAWQSVLDSLKDSQLDVTNREGGFIQTKWTDNTAEKNFAATFGSTDSYLKAQYRFHISIAKGFYNGQPTVKVSALKEQLVQRDVLEGWRSIATDTMDEMTLLYRIGRIVSIKMKIAKEQEEKSASEIRNAGF